MRTSETADVDIETLTRSAAGQTPESSNGHVNPARYQSLDIAKGVSVVLVVFWHVLMVARWTHLAPHSLYFEVNDILRYIRMPLFFFVSGIVIAHNLDEQWPRYFRKRLLQLIWIYLLWTAIYHVIQRRPPINLITSLYDAKIHLWFIWGLIIYRLGAKLLFRWRNIIIFVIGILSIASYADYPSEVWTMFHPNQRNVITYAFFFFAATWFGRPLVSWISRHPAATVSGALPAAIGAGVFEVEIVLAIAGVLTGLGLATAIRDHVAPLRRLFTFFGRSSLEIFVIHFALVGTLLRAMDDLPGANIWLVPVATLILVGVSILFRRLSDPIAPWLFSSPVWLNRIMDRSSRDRSQEPGISLDWRGKHRGP